MATRIERIFQVYFLTALFSTSGIDALLVVTALFFSIECARQITRGLAPSAYTFLVGALGQ